MPAVGRAGGLFKLLPRAERDEVAAALVRELREEAVGLVAALGMARFGAAAVARPRFGGTFSNLFTAAATEPGDFAATGDLGVVGATVSDRAVSGSMAGSAATGGGSMGAAAVSASAMVIVVAVVAKLQKEKGRRDA